MNTKIASAIAILAVLAMVVAFIPSVDGTDGTETTDTTMTSDDFVSLITNASTTEKTSIQLSNDLDVGDSMTLPVGSDITLDLNGNNLNLRVTTTEDGEEKHTNGRFTIPNGATLTITDSGTGGTITGYRTNFLQVNGNLNIGDGTINISGSGMISVNVGSTGTLVMTGGAVTSSYRAIYANGTVDIYGGSVGQIQFNGGTLTLGSLYFETSPTIDSLSPNNRAVNYIKGTVSSITSNIGVGSQYTDAFIFQQDISGRLPAGMDVREVSTGNYVLTELLPANAGAELQHNGTSTYYKVASKAASAMENGDTLILLNDCDVELEVSIYSGVIDLNGKSINVAGEDGVGLYIFPKYGTDVVEGPVKVVNYGSEESVISAATCISLNCGNSLERIDVDFGDNISLQPIEGGSAYDLDSSARLVYTENIAELLTTGGFRTTTVDGEYVYGSFGTAASDSVDGVVELINDYNQGISISSQGTFTLDLCNHVVTYNGSDAAITIWTDGTTLTVRNGTVNSADHGAWAGVNNGSTSNEDVTLILESVTINAQGSFGVYSNGECVNTTIEIVDSTINCKNVLNNEDGTTFKSVGVYFPCTGTLTIDNSKIYGYTGIEIRGGSIEVYGRETVISGEGEIKEDRNQNSGNTVEGAGLVINPYNDRTASATIYGGTITGTIGLYEATFQTGSEPSSVSIAMYGGTVESNNTDPNATKTGPIYTDDSEITNFVYGGMISGYDATAHSKYVASTSTVDENLGAVTPGTSQVNAVAQVDGVYYVDLDLAVQMAKSSGQELILLKTVTVGNGASLSIDGITISMGDGLTGPMFTTNVDSTLTLTNVTMTGNYSGIEMISVGNGTVVLTSCIVKDNQTSAITVNNGTLQMYDTTVSGMNNSDGYNGLGGAINSMDGTITIEGCIFENNIASENGGAIYADSGTLTISDTTFIGNSARVGGAIGLQSNFDNLIVTLDGLTITGNTATDMGGAIHAMVTRQDLADGSSWEYTIRMTLKDSIIDGDSNISPYDGQAITLYKYNTDTDITLTFSGTCGIDGTVSVLKYQDNDFLYASPKYVVEEGFGLAEGYSPISLAYFVSPDNGTTIVSGDGADPSMFSLYGGDQIFYVNADGELVASEYVTVTFEMYDGDVPIQVIAGDTIDFPESDRTGFSIDGWMKDGASWTGTTTDEDVTLAPIWKLDDFTVSISQTVSGSVLVLGVEITDMEGEIEGANTTYLWSDGSTGSDLTLTASGTYGVTVTLTPTDEVEAKSASSSYTYDSGHTVTFVVDGDPVLSLYVPDHGSVESYPEEPEKDGYMFWQWSVPSEGLTDITEDVTVTATWVPLISVTIEFSGPLYEGDSITATIIADVSPGEYQILYLFGLTSEDPEQSLNNAFTISQPGTYSAGVLVMDGDTLVEVGMSVYYDVPYSERPDDPIPDPPIIPDDDDYIPPIYVPSDTSSSDDDTVKIVACAAAAVVAAITAAFLILGHRRE